MTEDFPEWRENMTFQECFGKLKLAMELMKEEHERLRREYPPLDEEHE